MPIDYCIEKECVYTTASGEVTFEQNREMASRQHQDPAFHAHYDELVDCLAVTDFRISYQEMRLLAKIDPFSKKSRRAFVCNDELIHAMARSYESTRSEEGAEMALFKDIESAKEWLSLS